MSKFIICEEQKGIYRYKNIEQNEFLFNESINMNLVKSLYKNHYTEYANNREYFSIDFRMLDSDIMTWYFESKEIRDKIYNAIGSYYFHHLIVD